MLQRNEPLAYTHLDSPVGPLLIAGDGAELHLISFPSGRRAREPKPRWRREPDLFAEATKQLRSYFAGELRHFELPLKFTGTGFQKTVWRALCDIPFGETISYGALAARVGQPEAARAVGAANGANPLPIVAPCHRVIGADGSLTGFGGGLEVKRFLLDHEQKILGFANGQPLLL